MKRLVVTGLVCAMSAAAVGADDDSGLGKQVEQVLRHSFTTATPAEWKTRLDQDEVQALCSLHHNSPPAAVSERIAKLSSATMRYPEDGKLSGDWKKGEKLASLGTGGHIGKIQPDRPGVRRGGNCYACHVLAPDEIDAGNIGPSLAGYGRRFANSPATARIVYEKIWNAQAFLPCTQMPRFGANGWLTPQEVADTVAFLLDPESPVNR